MSEIVLAIIRDEDAEAIAKRRLDILLSYDLFGIAFNYEKHLDVVDTRRSNRSWLIGSAKVLLKRGIKEHWIARILFVNDFLAFAPNPVASPTELFDTVMKRIVSATSIDYASVLASPLAYSILFNLSSFALTQMIVAVGGVAGVGKTSLVYSSVKAVLRMLGLSEKEAQELFLAMYVQRMEDLVALLKLVEGRSLRLPLIVFDDAAVAVSAYMWFSESRKKLIEFSRALTISRERVANLIITGPFSAIFKGLRRLVHMVFTPVAHYDRLPGGRRLITSLWYVTMQDRLVDMTGTVTPHPLKVDDSVYALINQVKEKVREEVIEKIGEVAGEESEKGVVWGGEPEPQSRD
jgi:hypothetical protein